MSRISTSNPEDFIARVNSDLVGKYVNIASRASHFITQPFDGALRYSGDTEGMVAAAGVASELGAQELRCARHRQGHAGNHGNGGCNQSVVRHGQTLGVGEGSGKACRAAGCLLACSIPVPKS